MAKEYKLEDLEIYVLSMELGDIIWDEVEQWHSFAKYSVGSQVVRAADSIAANIAEGYGRYFFKESKNFFFYSRGSILETKTWIIKAQKRSLISEEKAQNILEQLSLVHKKLNAYIKFIQTQQTNSQINQ